MKSQSSIDVYNRIRNSRISHAKYKAAIEEFDFLIKAKKISGSPEGMLVIGEAGQGKTTLVNDMAVKYPPVLECDRWYIPVLVLNMPANPTIKGFCRAALDKMYCFANLGTARYRERDSEEQLVGRLVRLLINCGTLIVIIDETQHLVDGNKVHKSPYQVGDILKQIMDEASVSMVLAGVNSLEVLTNSNEQLNRRFSRRVDLDGFDNSDSGLKDLCQCVMSLVKVSGYEGDTSALLSTHLMEELYYATSGRIAYITHLLAEALYLSIEANDKAINKAHLEKAFERVVWRKCTATLNPFSKQFEFRKLERFGEPFHSGVRAHG